MTHYAYAGAVLALCLWSLLSACLLLHTRDSLRCLRRQVMFQKKLSAGLADRVHRQAKLLERKAER